MAKTPVRLHGPALVSNSAATKFTSSGKTVVRHIHVSNPSGSQVDFTASIGTDAAGTRIFDGLPIPADSERSFWGPYTLEDTQVFQALAGTNNVITLTIDGEEVT